MIGLVFGLCSLLSSFNLVEHFYGTCAFPCLSHLMLHIQRLFWNINHFLCATFAPIVVLGSTLLVLWGNKPAKKF
ncbi:hypothetical protein FKM82_000366 [Ascaphus truei]